MLALADPPPRQTEPAPGLIPGLKQSPEWHREQGGLERAWLDAYMRWCLRFRPTPARDQGGRR